MKFIWTIIFSDGFLSYITFLIQCLAEDLQKFYIRTFFSKCLFILLEIAERDQQRERPRDSRSFPCYATAPPPELRNKTNLCAFLLIRVFIERSILAELTWRNYGHCIGLSRNGERVLIALQVSLVEPMLVGLLQRRIGQRGTTFGSGFKDAQ